MEVKSDWITRSLGDVATLQRGFDLPHRNRVQGSIPIVTSSGIEDFHNVWKAQGPGVITGRYGTIGEVFYVSSYYWPHNTTLYVKDFHGNVPRYIYYLLKTVDFASHSGKSGVPGVNRNDLHQEFVKIPPTLREQEAIAGALSDADAWIESLEQLIAKKRQIKQGAMQELLTGKRRLPGFSGKWEWKRLGEVATFLSGGTPSRANEHYWKGTIPWISASSLRCFEVCHSDSNVTKEAVAAGSKMAPLGSTLLLVRGSALHNEILCGLVTRLVCFNQDVKALIPAASVVPRFLTTALRAREQDLLGMVTSAGNTAGVLDTKQLKAFEIPVPTSHEQMAITTVLSDMDTEIESLESKLAKAREVKQGMMQELLTGRIRLIEN